MDSNTVTHPPAEAHWWNDEEERRLLTAHQVNFTVAAFLETDHPRDSFMAMMVGIECFFKYVYAVTRYSALQDVSLLDRALRFLKISSPQASQYKCAVLKHDVGLVISELRKRYSNLNQREIQDFMMSL